MIKPDFVISWLDMKRQSFYIILRRKDSGNLVSKNLAGSFICDLMKKESYLNVVNAIDVFLL